MDPLSMTASLIAILQLTSTLLSFINDIRNAPREQAKIAVEASNLFSLLTSLRYRVEQARSDDLWFNQVKLLGVENGPLDQFKSILEKMVEDISSTRKRDRLKLSLTWKLTKSDTDDALGRMERLKSLIHLALSSDSFALSQAIHRDVVSSKAKIEEISRHTERLQLHVDDDLKRRLSQWLGIPDPSTNYHAANNKHQAGTGLWLLDSQQFADWKTLGSSLMWLHGDAGCGKTVLSAAALHNILQHQKSEPDIVACYFYFDFNDVEKQSPSKAIRSLLYQCTQQTHHGLQALEDIYRRSNDGQKQPAESEIRSLLRTVLDGNERIFILLDALDECANRDDLLPFLRDLVQAAPQKFHLLATSRPERDIEECLGTIAKYNIGIQSLTIDQDIKLYVQHRLSTDPKLKRWPLPVQNEILAVMMEKAGGMFRWAFCQLDSIRHCIKPGALRKTLTSLPKTLDETYNRILQGLEAGHQLDDAMKVLRWLCFSKEPLMLRQICEILAITEGASGSFDPDERLPDPNDITFVCSSLISLVRDDYGHETSAEDNSSCYNSEGYNSDEETINVDNTDENDVDEVNASLHLNNLDNIQVRLAHSSVKEFLTSDRSAFGPRFQPELCQEQMAEDCLHYLLHVCKQAPMNKAVVDRYPLAIYTAEFWWQHIQSSNKSLDAINLHLVLELLKENSPELLSWIQLYSPDRHNPTYFGHRLANLAPPLYYAALVGLTDVIEIFLQRSIDVNAEGGWYGNALQAASRNCHVRAVEVLIEAGAEVNTQGGSCGVALVAASCNSHSEQVVKILLNAGADVNLQDPESRHALWNASRSGNEKTVQVLLEAGANVDLQDYEGYSALHVAIENDLEGIVRLLLQAGADINLWAPDGPTPLYLAARDGYEKIVQLLVDAGADVNSDAEYGHALQVASSKGREKIVQMLLEAGADVNIMKHSTALRLAAEAGHQKIVQLLLEAGADVNIGLERSTVLCLAAERGYEKIVQMLLEAGAEVNIGLKHGTALCLAAATGHEKIVQMLLEAGADVNIVVSKGTALCLASENGHEEIVQTLLKAGANADLTSEEGNTALWVASENGHDKIVQSLVEHGADVEWKSRYSGSALMVAASGGHKEVLKILLDKGAEVNAEGGDDVYPLHAASIHGYDQVVRMLLDAGAGADLQTEDLGSALYTASVGYLGDALWELKRRRKKGLRIDGIVTGDSEEGRKKVVQMLIDAGADIHAGGGTRHTKWQEEVDREGWTISRIQY